MNINKTSIIRGDKFMDTRKNIINDKSLESMKKMQEIISATSSAINLEQVRNSLLKMSEKLSLLAKNNWTLDIGLINPSLQNSLRDFSHTIAQLQSTYDMEIVRQSISRMAKALSNMQTEQLKSLSQIDFRKLNFDFQSKEFDDLVDLAYEATIEDTSDVAISKEELKETFIESRKNDSAWKKFNVQLHDGMEKFKREYFILYVIIMFLLQHIGYVWFDETIGKQVIPKAASIVRELPEKSSEIICHLEQNIEATIIENQNYYYKVSFIDEDGIEREGYVAKRNLKIVDQEEDLEKQPSTVSGNGSLNNE